MDQDESDALLAELRAFATQPRFVYAHQWKAGDAILWDNRSTLHCATPFDEERYDRLMLRTQLAGTIPV
jgi:taurine dioxygenase